MFIVNFYQNLDVNSAYIDKVRVLTIKKLFVTWLCSKMDTKFVHLTNIQQNLHIFYYMYIPVKDISDVVRPFSLGFSLYNERWVAPTPDSYFRQRIKI